MKVKRLHGEPLGAMLKAWRERLNWSQPKAADILGVPTGTFQGWEQGRRMPYPLLLRVTCAAIEDASRVKHEVITEGLTDEAREAVAKLVGEQ